MFCRWFFLVACAAAAQPPKDVLVVTAQGGDYLVGAGGTLASLIDEGYRLRVLQVTNDEKNSLDLGPAETRKANNEQAERAARLLGATEVINLGHKAGELGYIASTELRNEVIAMIRYFKPRIIFIPDPYVHYVPNGDVHYVGKMAEEACGYSGPSTFNPELARMGFPGYSVPEIYYYAVGRPYRPGEGGEERAQFRTLDISATIERKVKAILALETANRLYAAQTQQRLREAGRSHPRLERLDTPSVNALVRAHVEELAATIGKKHGFRYGEEFNYVGPGESLQEHIRERARPVR